MYFCHCYTTFKAVKNYLVLAALEVIWIKLDMNTAETLEKIIVSI